ncbi:MAG: thiamine pyrophosphate-binding protein [Actinomycetota bacterium]
MAYDEDPSTDEPDLPDGDWSWHKLIDAGEVDEGRVTTRTVGHVSLAVTNVDGAIGALDNRCPHQGGPLGEGSIEQGWLRCPWHGYDYSPCNGRPPGGFDDRPAAFRTEQREDGVYVALPDETPRRRTVSDAMVETLTAWGVSHVFGMVGHSNLGFADAMREAEERGDLTYVAIRHEGAAAFAASAYGKLTGELAACFGIAGPGSTNLLTGLYDAKVDRAPVLAISGSVPSKDAGRGAFQDLDLSKAFQDVSAYSVVLQEDSNHVELTNLACKTALIERGVGHLVLPDDVQVVPGDGVRAGGPAGRVGERTIAPPETSLAAAMRQISSAKRPVFVVGHGSRFDMAAITELAERLGAPVVTTFKGKGLISDRHELGCGVLGRSGTPIASWFMNESDLLVVWGASFSNHTGIAPYKPIVQVDYDPMALGRFHAVDVPVLGHVGVTARAMLDRLDDDIACLDHRAEVAERWAIWRAEKARRREDDRGEGVSAAALFDALTDVVPADAVLPVDVGNNTYSFGRYFEVDRQSVIMSGYLGSIGFGFPAAMGAWAAVGGRRKVVSVSGDGGFGQYAMEVTTAVRHDMDLTHVLMVNGELGKISKEQRSAELDVWQTSLVNPDFAEFARSCGALGIRVSDRAELAGALRSAIEHAGPALVQVDTDAALV